MRMPLFVIPRFVVASTSLGLLITACGEPKNDENTTSSPSDPTASSASETDSAGSSESGNDPSIATTQMSMTSPSDESGSGEEESGNDSIMFIAEPDGGSISNECDIWAQDCPDGEKCMPWANDGGGSWNATRCSPLDANPGQPGDSCTVEGSGVSGIDNCDIAAMCWNTDAENIGTCVGFCEGSEANPVCPNPGTGCSITNEGTLILCLPFCDPLLQDCSDTEACYPEPNGFFCSPDASGEMGAFGDPCEFLNVCDAGLFCADAGVVPDCAGSTGCCSEYCDISDPNPVCMGAGQECTPFYEENQAPPGYENVGVCVIPQ
ncbi:MAG: ribulose phosphate epimerase [Deltaproteobacteria bacterium]|nr:ribulose phosphate epimerase [Nannocystaceae bacterium]